jgi:hypothetical protein
VKVEACDSIRDASDTLMLRGGPEGTITYLTERLTSFGQAAMDVGDLGAVEVLANTYVGIGTTEKTFMAARNYNPAPMYECANLVLANADDKNKAEAVELLAAAFYSSSPTFTTTPPATYLRPPRMRRSP